MRLDVNECQRFFQENYEHASGYMEMPILILYYIGFFAEGIRAVREPWLL